MTEKDAHQQPNAMCGTRLDPNSNKQECKSL